MKKICIIQPVLNDYTLPLFRDLSRYYDIDIIFSKPPIGSAFGPIPLLNDSNIKYFEFRTLKPMSDRIGMYQVGVFKHLLRRKPQAIIMFANPRYLSFWAVLIFGKIMHIPVYPHGHGLYKKSQKTLFIHFMYSMILKLSEGYICYNELVKQSFLNYGFSNKKLSVAKNSLINRYPLHFDEKTGQENGILFIGRLRNGCNISLLMKVINRIRTEDKISLTLHIIGNGKYYTEYQKYIKDNKWIHLYGEVYNQEYIRQLSRLSFIGCYPGNAGLSVVHMISLSLPPIIHDEIRDHHGPEPSYIKHQWNGLLFKHNDAEKSLYEAIKYATNNPALVKTMQKNAFECYQELVNPSLAKRLSAIIK